MATESALLAGRKWRVEAPGEIKSLTREYMVKLNGGVPLGANGEIASFPGVPAIGSAHPNYPYLVVTGYDVAEGSDNDKHTLRVTPKYEAQTITEEPVPGSTDPDDKFECATEEWGWSDSTEQHELTEDALSHVAVVNSAGDPFDRAPMVDAPAPVFTKVMRMIDRRAGWADFLCKVNRASVQIGGRTFEPRTLLCTISERRIFGDSKWNYRYTVTLKYRSNKVKLGGALQATEVGWDVAIVDTGMREWDGSGSGRKVLIRVMDAETGKMATVTSPALLDGSGHAQVQQSGTQTLTPYILKFAAYEDADFPAWFCSEPGVDPEPEEE